MSGHTVNPPWACGPKHPGGMLVGWEGGWTLEGPMAIGFSALCLTYPRRWRTSYPGHGAHRAILWVPVISSPHHTTQERNEETFTENLTQACGSLLGDCPVPETSLCAYDRSGDFPVRRLKQTKWYSAQKDFPHCWASPSAHPPVPLVEFIISGQHLVWKNSSWLRMCVVVTWRWWE